MEGSRREKDCSDNNNNDHTSNVPDSAASVALTLMYPSRNDSSRLGQKRKG